MNPHQTSEFSKMTSLRINAKHEDDYLNFVQSNIFCREKELENQRESVTQAAANNQAVHSLRNFYQTAKVPDPDNPYFIRIDLSDGTTRYYGHIRLRHCSDEPIPDSHSGIKENLILSSRADGKGYTADYPENLPDLVARTRFQIVNGKIIKISEEIFGEGSKEHQVIASDVVAESIQQTRKRKMEPISSTLQPDQFGISRESAGQSLAIQGPPGSGKTAVLLERLARIAFADETVSQKGMLLVGPNRPFMEYVASVLPTLGENDVSLKSIDDVSGFSSQVTNGALETEDLIYLKGSDEFRFVLDNLVETAPKITSKSYFFTVDDINLEFSPADALKILDFLDHETFTTYRQLRNVGENQVMNLLVERFLEEWNSTWSQRRRLQNDPAVMIAQESTFRTIVRNMFPLLEPKSLLDKMKSDASYFVEISKGIIEHDDQIIWLKESELLVKKITPSDVPILDYLDGLLGESPQKWGHIAIDETQDLNPMQLAMIARRIDSNGTFSLAGDLAQATGTHYYTEWSSPLHCLQGNKGFVERQLTRSYRVPSEILAYAQQFLKDSRISVAPSEPFLNLPNSLNMIEIENSKDRFSKVISIAGNCLKAKQSVLVIASANDRSVLEKLEFPQNENAFVRILEPTVVKGLEFDAVIILNPDKIIEDYDWHKSRLARLFYVLSTRATKSLYLVGNKRVFLENPLTNVPDDEEETQGSVNEKEDEELFVENVLINSTVLETFENAKTLPLLRGKAHSSSSTGELEDTQLLQSMSIEMLCKQLNVPIKQMSEECLNGQWIFVGATQIKCDECADKPQLVFIKHPHNKHEFLDEKHIYAFGCTNCSTIRIRQQDSILEKTSLNEELKITALLKRDCLGCDFYK